MLNYLKDVLKNVPTDWLKLTTHRLDIYNEKLAKTEFLDQFEDLYSKGNTASSILEDLPTAFDYIRLGHPLSCVLEWAIGKQNGLPAKNIISFSSKTTPILAVLRKNLFENRKTRILYTGDLVPELDIELLHRVYGYTFELEQVADLTAITASEGSTIFLASSDRVAEVNLIPEVDFYVQHYPRLGSVILVNGEENEAYISEIQHVRRRETIAMTPADCLIALNALVNQTPFQYTEYKTEENKEAVKACIADITGSTIKSLVGSSGLSVQYAIMMGLLQDAFENYPDKDVKIVVPTNCYGGTNDQARRVAACLNNVEVVDLAVDGDNDMVQSIDAVLEEIASQDAVPYIIAEIPTNPRVEVPDLLMLKDVLSKKRTTATGLLAVDPVFILDQTFCPNVRFVEKGAVLSDVRTISYVSGSKFPSGGRCTAGYCIGNEKAAALMDKVELHFDLCDNTATDLQMQILAEQMPSMLARIKGAYDNTRVFVNFIEKILPEAKINFVSEELAAQGFTPSVFSLDLPSKGATEEEKEAYKRALNHKLINLMITKIPAESKYCVSYGQLKGCYWTIPATSTQGTTKEGDKDYIARVALSADMDLEKHQQLFAEFVESIG